MRQARPRRQALIEDVAGGVRDMLLSIGVFAAIVPIVLVAMVLSLGVAWAVGALLGRWLPPALATALGLAWLAVSLGVVLLTWRALVRRLPQRVRATGDAADDDERPLRDPDANPDTLLARVAALDSRFDDQNGR